MSIIYDDEEYGYGDPDKGFNMAVGRTEDFHDIAYTLDDYVNALPISNEQNNKLLDLILKQVIVAEKDAFSFGIGLMGMALGIADSENREIEQEDMRKAYKLYLARKEEDEDNKVRH